MIGYISKLRMICMLLASAVTVGACGGGNNPQAAAPDVVVVKKGIVRGINAASKEVEAVAFQGINILEVRCAFVFPAPAASGMITSVTTGTPDFMLLLDVAAADVEKTKAFGFSLLSAEEQAIKSSAVCT